MTPRRKTSSVPLEVRASGDELGVTILIRLKCEAEPLVCADVLTEGEAARLDDWLDAHPAYRELVDLAVELTEKERPR